MMGRLEENHDALVDKTTGGVIVLPGDHVVVRRRRQEWVTIARIGRSALRPVQFLHGALPPLAAGPPHRAAQGDAEPGIQPGGRGERDRHVVLLRVQPVQPVLVSRGSRSEERLHAEQAAAGGREEALGEPALQPAAAASCTWKTARRRCGG